MKLEETRKLIIENWLDKCTPDCFTGKKNSWKWNDDGTVDVFGDD